MANAVKRPLKAFLCHASGDKPPVRDLYKRLTAEGVDAWLDKERLLPGQDWRMEIPRAVREADVVIVCLSKKSITKEGYVQKEIKFALDVAEEKPEGTIFLIPARLEDCVVPDRLNRWQWVDLYEDDGFVRLLRSLKLRADAVDATVEPTSYIDSEKETDHRLEQLYTEGLAAFYTEDWDKACQRFQSILSERPNHKNASEKLEEAKRQRDLAKLYEQAIVAVRSDDWVTAIQIIEELSNKSVDYKDVAQLLKNARKQKQLRELYAEAKALQTGQQWEAIVKVFEQISSIDPNYPDADELLPSAQKEVAELKRIGDLNDQYSHALREMDSSNWYEARRLLETVHKSQTGFLETEKLLKKVENEIKREEEKRKQNDQINTLYEQAHGLLRSKKWRNALDKMGEIRKLDEGFSDTDGIAEKAKKELAREEQEAERQNKLAALYAEAVKLLKEEKYQNALDKWGEVKAIDPKYPDRQWVRRTARRKIAETEKPIKNTLRIGKRIFIGVVSTIAIVLVIVGVYFVFFSKPNCASIEECQQLAQRAFLEKHNSELALEYFDLAIGMVPPSLRLQHSELWRDRASILDLLGQHTEAQKDRDVWWLYNTSFQKIVFNSDRDGNNEIYVTDVKGEKVVRLTFDSSNDWGAVWSPDGSTIAFTSDRSGNNDIYLMDLDGSNTRNLTNNPARDASPSWSPDGSKIAFNSDRNSNSDIFIVNADGDNLTCIVFDDTRDWRPAWSPDGSKIVYVKDVNGDYQEVAMVNIDGSNFQNLSNHEADDSNPSWSPDGKKITFTSTRLNDEDMIYVLDLESNMVKLLVDAHGWGSKWSPNGNQIVFTSYDMHDNEIALYDLQTKELVFITNNDANDERPSWSPLP